MSSVLLLIQTINFLICLSSKGLILLLQKSNWMRHCYEPLCLLLLLAFPREKMLQTLAVYFTSTLKVLYSSAAETVHRFLLFEHWQCCVGEISRWTMKTWLGCIIVSFITSPASIIDQLISSVLRHGRGFDNATWLACGELATYCRYLT